MRFSWRIRSYILYFSQKGVLNLHQWTYEQLIKMIENYLHKSQMLRCVFLLIDIRHEPSSNDKLMYDWIVSQGFQPILIATKADKIKRSQLQKQLKILRTGLGVGTEVMMIPFSAETKQGREEIWNYLETEIWKVEHPGE